jgi:hypothetical protein
MDKITTALATKVSLARTLLTKGSVHNPKLIEEIAHLRHTVELVTAFELVLFDWNDDVD